MVFLKLVEHNIITFLEQNINFLGLFYIIDILIKINLSNGKVKIRKVRYE